MVGERATRDSVPRSVFINLANLKIRNARPIDPLDNLALILTSTGRKMTAMKTTLNR